MARIRTIKPEFFGSQVADPDWKNHRYGLFLLYRFYAQNGELLYIGVTSRPAERFTVHRRNATWWGKIGGIKTERMTCHRAVLAAEVAAIRAERPAFNRRSAT